MVLVSLKYNKGRNGVRKNREKGASGGGRGEDEGENGKLEKWGKKRDWMRRGEYEEIEKQIIYAGVGLR